MPISRLVFSSYKHSPKYALNLLQRFGPSKKLHSCPYTSSSRYNNGKPSIEPLKSGERGKGSSISWSAYVVPAAVLGFAGLATLVHYNDERRAVPKGSGQGSNISRNSVAGPIIGGSFTLLDTEKQIVTEKNLLGNWVLLYFGYTSSPDVGPEQVQLMAQAVDVLESKQNVKVLPVFVTIDPQRDTPSHLRAYLKEFDSRIVGLTGPISSVRQMAQEYRVFFKKIEEEIDDYLIESSHNMYLLNPKMEVVRCFGVEYNAEDMSEAVLKEVKRFSTL